MGFFTLPILCHCLKFNLTYTLHRKYEARQMPKPPRKNGNKWVCVCTYERGYVATWHHLYFIQSHACSNNKKVHQAAIWCFYWLRFCYDVDWVFFSLLFHSKTWTKFSIRKKTHPYSVNKVAFMHTTLIIIIVHSFFVVIIFSFPQFLFQKWRFLLLFECELKIRKNWKVRRQIENGNWSIDPNDLYSIRIAFGRHKKSYDFSQLGTWIYYPLLLIFTEDSTQLQ